MKNEKNWKKELAVDVRALGSWVFFSLVLIRYAIGPFFPSLWRVLTAGIVIALAGVFFKNFEGYTTRGLALAVFVSMHYQDILFSAFAAIIFIGMLFSVKYLGESKQKISNGLLVGLLSIVLGYAVGGVLTTSF